MNQEKLAKLQAQVRIGGKVPLSVLFVSLIWKPVDSDWFCLGSVVLVKKCVGVWHLPHFSS